MRKFAPLVVGIIGWLLILSTVMSYDPATAILFLGLSMLAGSVIYWAAQQP